jgi:DNA-binding transcriptional LysR family regulator
MNVCRARDYKPKVYYQFDRAEAVLLSVSAGLGISIVPEALTKTFFSEHCVFKRIDGDDALRKYVIAWKHDITSPSAKLFLEVVQELFPNKK